MFGFVTFWFGVMFAFTCLTIMSIEDGNRGISPFVFMAAMVSSVIFTGTLIVFLHDTFGLLAGRF